MPQEAQPAKLKPQDAVGHRLSGGQARQGFVGQVEQFRMRVVLVGQLVEQFRDVVAGVQPGQVAAGDAEPPLELGFGQQVEGLGRFAEEDYSTQGQQVKSRLERAFEPLASLRQTLYLAKLAGEQGHHQAAFGELDDPQDDRRGFFGGHDGVASGV